MIFDTLYKIARTSNEAASQFPRSAYLITAKARKTQRALIISNSIGASFRGFLLLLLLL